MITSIRCMSQPICEHAWWFLFCWFLLHLGPKGVLCSTTIYSQGGIGFSGLVQRQPMSGDITMTAFQSWPTGSQLSLGSDAFQTGAFDGHLLWLVPCNSFALIALDPQSGRMTAYSSWPSGSLSLGSSQHSSVRCACSQIRQKTLR